MSAGAGSNVYATGEADPRSDSLRNSSLRNRTVRTSLNSFARRCVAGLALAAAVGLSASPRLASASDTLELIPDYAFFDLIKLGLISDESGIGALWVMLIAFALLALPLNALLFQPIFRALDARAERIQGARARSEHLQREADAILERYESAVRETRGEAEAARQVEIARAREEQVALTSQVKHDAERQIESARADLARSLETARASLRASADDLARSAAEQVLGRALS